VTLQKDGVKVEIAWEGKKLVETRDYPRVTGANGKSRRVKNASVVNNILEIGDQGQTSAPHKEKAPQAPASQMNVQRQAPSNPIAPTGSNPNAHPMGGPAAQHVDGGMPFTTQTMRTREHQENLIPAVTDKTILRVSSSTEFAKWADPEGKKNENIWKNDTLGGHRGNRGNFGEIRVNQGSIQRYEDQLGGSERADNYQKSTGFKVPSNSRTVVESTIAHEHGHAVDNMTTMQDRHIALTRLSEALLLPPPVSSIHSAHDMWVAQHKDFLAKQVSIYGATNSSELIAEIWSEYSLSTNAKPARPHIAAAGKVLFEAANRKGNRA
jgi:hypothetical protein